MKRTAGIALLVIVAGAGVVVVGVGTVWYRRQRVEAARPNVLLVTFDTTRADHIGCYGWRHARTPAIDGLAEDGIRFERVYAAVPLTLPSHTAIMTGQYPFYNGVRDNSSFQLHDEAHTLAEVFREQGYQTGACVAAFVLDARFGLDQGFDRYSDEVPGRAEFERFEIPERNAQAVVDDAIGWLSGLDRSRPFFLWVHFYDPHHPYRTPASFPFYQGSPYDQEIAYADYEFKRLLEHLDRSPPNDRQTLTVVTADHGEALGEYGEETHGYFVYDATLHVPLVIKLPDEAHAGTVVSTTVSLVDVMPTIIELAGLPALGKDEIHGRSLVELWAGAPTAAEDWRSRPVYFECYSPMYSFGWAPVRGIRLDQDKYIDSPEPELYRLADDPREGMLRNAYGANPALADTLARVLTGFVDAPLSVPRLDGSMQVVDSEVIQRLRALGYLASASPGRPEYGPEDDVKKRLPLYNGVLSALQQIGGGQSAEGVRTLLEVLKQDPDNPRGLWLLAEVMATDLQATADGLPVIEQAARNPAFDAAQRAAFTINCGRAYLALGEAVQALGFFQGAVELEPDNASSLGWLSVGHLYLGQVSEALQAARQAAEHAPQIVHLQVLLGLTQFVSGDVSGGDRTWHQLLAGNNPPSVWEIAAVCTRDPTIAAMSYDAFALAAANPDVSPPVRATLLACCGQMALAAGQYESALAALQGAADRLGADDVDAAWWRAKALMALGRLDEAEQLLRRAYELDPDRIVVVADLATLLHQTGNAGEAVRILSDYYDAHPDDPTAANNLAWILAEHPENEADLERALQLAKSAVKWRRSSASFLDTLGWVHLRRQDSVSAVYAFSQAVCIDENNPTYHYHLGLAYRLDGQPDKAREAFAKAVELAPTPRPTWFDEAQQAAVAEDGGASQSP
jgi:arylsulfatase A-like enzyme/Flp pilus assembly protein TadD